MFPALLRVLKKGISKRSNIMIMTLPYFFPLFLIAEIESEEISSDAGTVYNPSSFRYPSSLLIHPKASLYQNACTELTCSLRSAQSNSLKDQKGLCKNEWLCHFPLFYPRCKFKKPCPLTHAISLKDTRTHVCPGAYVSDHMQIRDIAVYAHAGIEGPTSE